MVTWWKGFSQRPFVVHLMRARSRFSVRGGAQLAAAIAYFSVLALVPILMLAFSVLGLIATVLRPEALSRIQTWTEVHVHIDTDLGRNIYEVIHNALTNWAWMFGFGLVVVVWVSSRWVGNLKRAVRLVMREDVDRPGKQLPLLLDLLANFAGLVGLLVGVAATFAASTMATVLAGAVGSWMGIEKNLGWTLTLLLAGLMIALSAGAGLFRLLFLWFSPRRVPGRLAWIGAALGSFGLVALQVLAGYLIRLFSRNLGTAVFGSTIVLMLFLNLFATLLIYIAAWLATAQAPVVEPVPSTSVFPPPPAESVPGELYVSSEVAKRTLGIGLGMGYVVGAATGLGLGSLITSVMSKLFGRRG